MSPRLIMFGTGLFALPTFRALCDSEHGVVGLFTQPDRRGRGHHRHRNAMKELAQSRGLPVFQPENVNAEDALTTLKSLKADLCVVAAYGQILSQELLDIPGIGTINVHASCLPKYRGAAPVSYAILSGETETGVTVFQIQPELDAGPVLGMETTSIEANETAGELEARLAHMAAPLVLRVVGELAQGTIQPIPQDATQATRAPRLKKKDGSIDWNTSAVAIERHIRAMQPWPKSDTCLCRFGAPSIRVQILRAESVDFLGDTASAEHSEVPDKPLAAPGAILFVDKQQLIVQTADGALSLLELQPAGKRAMTIREFLCGHAVQTGDRFEQQTR